MPRRIIVIQVDGTEEAVASAVDELRAAAEALRTDETRIEVGVGPSLADEFPERLSSALDRADDVLEAIDQRRAEFAQCVKPGDPIIWWSDDEGFRAGQVAEVEASTGGRSFRIAGSGETVGEEDLYQPLTEHDAELWRVAEGDEVEWHWAPNATEGAGWQRGRVIRVIHDGFEAPSFQVEGCSETIREPLFEIRVPAESR